MNVSGITYNNDTEIINNNDSLTTSVVTTTSTTTNKNITSNLTATATATTLSIPDLMTNGCKSVCLRNDIEAGAMTSSASVVSTTASTVAFTLE